MCLTANGTIFQWTISSTLTAIAKIVSIDGPEEESENIECVALDSDAAENESGGITYARMVSLVLNYDPENAGHVALIADRKAGTQRAAKIILTNADEITFSGYVKRFKITGITVNGLVQAECDIMPSGEFTFPT